ncbi:uncharacterized protein A4U43_UnF1430 [Asparagus officinalis]|uniref:NAC domain-containing protein n=1 Tax=Asparagus officinalis TaxID=4686 RepID=A0A1R3L7J3_ASPOF|nr:uncharacterized protein A4U43_UnF1430 [Asparagus officinalis]
MRSMCMRLVERNLSRNMRNGEQMVNCSSSLQETASTPHSSRPARHTHDGARYWKTRGINKSMQGPENHFAESRILDYCLADCTMTNWAMNEFMLVDAKDKDKKPAQKQPKPENGQPNNPDSPKIHDGCVLCTITRKVEDDAGHEEVDPENAEEAPRRKKVCIGKKKKN